MSNGNGHRWSKFWWQDWQNDKGLRLCSLAARGLWMELLCIAHESGGYLEVNGNPLTPRQITTLVRAQDREVMRLLGELKVNGVFSVTDDGIMFCRRMVRDAERSAEGRDNIRKRWGNKADGEAPSSAQPNGEANEDPNRVPNREPTSPPSRDPNSLYSEAEAEAEEDREGRRAPRATPPFPLPPLWQPTVEMVEFGISLGLSDPAVQRAAERMRDWSLSKGQRLADWDAFFRNWLRRDAEDPPFRNGALQLIHDEGMPSVETANPVSDFLARFPNGPH